MTNRDEANKLATKITGETVNASTTKGALEAISGKKAGSIAQAIDDIVNGDIPSGGGGGSRSLRLYAWREDGNYYGGSKTFSRTVYCTLPEVSTEEDQPFYEMGYFYLDDEGKLNFFNEDIMGGMDSKYADSATHFSVDWSQQYSATYTRDTNKDIVLRG